MGFQIPHLRELPLLGQQRDRRSRQRRATKTLRRWLSETNLLGRISPSRRPLSVAEKKPREPKSSPRASNLWGETKKLPKVAAYHRGVSTRRPVRWSQHL